MKPSTRPQDSLTAAERSVMKMTFKGTMLRAADIIDKITELDVVEMQERMLRDGVSLEKVARMDRAMIASAHLRAIAKKERA